MHVAGRAKSGYFPTPPSVLSLLSTLITNPDQHQGRILDPCAGEGVGLSYLAKRLGLDGYAIELDRQRATQCSSRLTHIIRSDAGQCHVQRDAFSALFLNPPYDNAGHGERTEYLWLKRWTTALQPDGILIYLIPEHQYSESVIEYLSTFYRDISLYRFPTKDYRAFQQTIFFGKRVRHPNPSQLTRRHIWRMIRGGDIPTIGDSSQQYAYVIPPLAFRGEIDFYSTWLDPSEIYEEAHLRGLWEDPHTQELLSFERPRHTRPLLPLRKGHLTRLIVAGLFNNQTLSRNNRHWLIKGRSRKDTKELPPIEEIIHTADGPKERTQYRTIERYVPEIRAWDVTPGETFGTYIVVDC